jgi:hypothetical protein
VPLSLSLATRPTPTPTPTPRRRAASPSTPRFLLHQPNKQQQAYVRALAEEDKLTISLVIAGRLCNLER